MESIVVVLAKMTLTVQAVLKTVHQAANDVNNEWGVERIIVVNTLNPSSPPTPEQIAVMVRASDFKGLYRSSGQMVGGMEPV